MLRPRRGREHSSSPPKVAANTLLYATSQQLPYLHPKIDIADLDLASAEDISHARLKQNIKKTITHDGIDYHVYLKGNLGSGKYGEVELAQNAKTGEWIALKTIKQVSSTIEKEYFSKEVANLANTGNLVFHYQRMQHNYIGMKLQPGIELFHVLNGITQHQFTPLSQEQKLHIAKRVFYAAACLHKAMAAVINPELQGLIKKLIHRDFKPENMLLDGGLEIHIVDFGVATMVEDIEEGMHEARYIGTREHMAPESKDAKKEAPYNNKTDVFGLGVLLMKLICNNTNLEQNPLHPEMVNLINALTDPDPASRPAADEAYRLINRIPSLHVNANDSTHPSDFIAYTVSLHDVLRLGQAKILLDQFARQLVRQGAKSIALMGDVSKVEQAELVYIQRALQKAGILHIAPLVYSTRAGLHVAEKAAENYYNATFRTPQTTLLCSREIAKNILKSKQQGIHASGVFSTPHPPNKVLPVRPSSGRQNSK